MATTEFIEKVRTCFTKYISELEKEMDEIGNRPEGYHRSHDEMAMDDQRWDELDRKVMKIREMMESLEKLPAAAQQQPSEELNTRIAKIQALMDAISAAEGGGAVPVVEEEEKYTEYDAYGCHCLECLNYEEDDRGNDGYDGGDDGCGVNWNESGYFD
jgi:hypothetical protein